MQLHALMATLFDDTQGTSYVNCLVKVLALQHDIYLLFTFPCK